MVNSMSVRHRALVTGASRGIGRELALALARRCERIFLVGRDESALSGVRDQIREADTVVLAGDLCDVSFVDRLARTVMAEGGIDLLVNNAGISEFSSFERQARDSIHQLVAVNLLGPMQLTRALLPALLGEPSAQVIAVGSTFSYIGYPGFSAYCATKFGLRGFSEALGRELSDTGVRVRLFSPRATKTDINSQAVRSLNRDLGVAEDSVALVAQEFMKFLDSSATEYRVGFPEKLFAKINQIWPGLVGRSLQGQLPRIRQALLEISDRKRG